MAMTNYGYATGIGTGAGSINYDGYYDTIISDRRRIDMTNVNCDMQFLIDTYGQIHPITSIDALSTEIFRDEEGLAFALAEEEAEKNGLKGNILYAKVNGSIVMIDYCSSWCRTVTGALGYDSEYLKMSVLMSWSKHQNAKNERFLYNRS